MGSNGLLLSFFGDDLTGSTDAMEALELGGVSTVLFLGVPNAAMLARFADRRAVGLAGSSRSETPAWMDRHLRDAFAWLRTLDPAVVHYKVCSTFDSAPHVGSIGRAIEIGRDVFHQPTVPLLVGAPQLRRYTAFGTLFAAYSGRIYRIDRHPVMSRHPVTPMDEADLLLHLARQTTLSSGLVDLADLQTQAQGVCFDRLVAEGAGIVLFDVDGRHTQALAGAELWRACRRVGPFVVGSSGVEYALLAEWQKLEMVGQPAVFAPPGPVDRLAVVSGSVSPTTERQIGHAMANGFEGVALDPLALVGENGESALADAVQRGSAALRDGKSVVLFSALGPSADRGLEIDRDAGARHRLGQTLGRILAQLVAQQGLRRAVVAGGDTSSHALSQIGVEALTVRLPLPQTPGSPLCVAHGAAAEVEGLEIALKGGQIGADDYFVMVRQGIASPAG